MISSADASNCSVVCVYSRKMLRMRFNVAGDGMTSTKSLTCKRRKSEAKNGAGVSRAGLFGALGQTKVAPADVDRLADDGDGVLDVDDDEAVGGGGACG